MKKLDTMSLAWKIYKLTPLTTKFKYALIYAWKIAKNGGASISDKLLIIYKKLDIFGYKRKTTTKTEIKFDSYYMNLFLYQLNRIGE